MQSILYVSPFWPVRSGISEYSAALVWELKKHFSVTLLIDNYKPQYKKLEEEFIIFHHPSETNSVNWAIYDYIVYNFGNNPDAHGYMYDLFLTHPGHIILHDLSLYYLTIDHYQKKNQLFQEIYGLEGIDGIIATKDSMYSNHSPDLLLHKELSSKLLMNYEILSTATGIFVHSEYTRRRVLDICPQSDVSVIPFVNCMPEISLDFTYNLHEEFCIPKDEVILASPGLIGPSKQNLLCCEAVLEYNRMNNRKVHYVMVGDGNYVDSYIGSYIHKTGFLNNEQFFSALKQSDLIFNLRYPYGGETSSTIIQCMLLGKTCVATRIGWFAELPDNAIYKVEPDISAKELSKKIDIFLTDHSKSISAYNYVQAECTPQKVVEKLTKLFK